MSYRPNQSQQLSIFDRSLRLTERERKCLERSWAKVFSDEIFPAIDEERFRVLYSETASRPNTPVNVIVGALIIKELFDLSDDEVVENLMLDVHYQYALHTTSYEEQPLSDKTLSRFRRRCYEYERLNGVHLSGHLLTTRHAEAAAGVSGSRFCVSAQTESFCDTARQGRMPWHPALPCCIMVVRYLPLRTYYTQIS